MSEFEKKMEELKEGEAKKSYAEIQKEKTRALMEKAKAYSLEAVKSVSSFRKLLETAAHFTRLSENNMMLIALQHEGATKLETFENWQKQKGTIKKGAKGIHIIGAKEYVGKDGAKHTAFFDDCKFDISDVDNVEAPVTKTYEQKELMKALVHSAASKMQVDSDYPEDQTDGAYYDAKTSTIHCQYGMTFNDMFTSVCKAIAHSEVSEANEHYRNSDGEFYARSVAYIFARKYDVPTTLCEINSIPAEFQSMEPDRIFSEVCRVLNCARSMDNRMSTVLNRPKTQNKENNHEVKKESETKEQEDKGDER